MIKTYRRSKEHKLHLLCRVCFADLEHDNGVIFEDKNDKYGLVVPLCDDCKRVLMDKMRDIICFNKFDLDETKEVNKND